MYLDEDRRIPVRPDVVHVIGGRERAVYDAKYKLGYESGGFPPADIYQMFAYCTIMGLSEGHLIYAGTKADYGGMTEATVRRSGVTVRLHALDVSVRPSELLAQVQGIASASMRQAACV